MNIRDFISGYKNHPILFVGTGLSLRYLKYSYSWDGLLKHIAVELKGNDEYYYDVKSMAVSNGVFDYAKIAKIMENDFNKALFADRNGKFKNINDRFYDEMKNGSSTSSSRFKFYVSELMSNLSVKEEMKDELMELKKTRKNVGSIITTNYDRNVESIFEFSPLFGNDILLSNPYGSVYKIHGCVTDPQKIIITSDDYELFNKRYELIRAQLLSLFIHNPIIFLGYSIADENIKSILRTVFSYVELNSAVAERIRKNFLLVEYEAGSESTETTEHDIDVQGHSTIRINKIKTNNFSEIYKSISALKLPVSAMDIRKVQGVVKEIYSGGSIKVSITDDLDSLANGDKILAIGSINTIRYEYQNASEMVGNYFSIMDEENSQLVGLIDEDKFIIANHLYFPICGFGVLRSDLKKFTTLKDQQVKKVNAALGHVKTSAKRQHAAAVDVLNDPKVSKTYKLDGIMWNFMEGRISFDDLEIFLRGYQQKSSAGYKSLLCAFDLKKYGSDSIELK